MKKPTLSDRMALRAYPENDEPLMTQRWENILFLNWDYDPHEIQKTLPKGLSVDTYLEKAYVGINLFKTIKPKLKFIPFFPGLSDFFQINVQTYVYDEQGTPGVWFYSMNANNQLIVETAKSFFNLPYYHADLKMDISSDHEIHLKGNKEGHPIDFIYKSSNSPMNFENDSIEAFFGDRYLLYSTNENGALMQGRIHHPQINFQEVEVEKCGEHIIELDGFHNLSNKPTHAMFSANTNVDIFKLNAL